VDDRISCAQPVQTVVRDYPLLQLWLKNQAISAGASKYNKNSFEIYRTGRLTPKA
jgi:hypothetical protein